jgi:hypothetical protein
MSLEDLYMNKEREYASLKLKFDGTSDRNKLQALEQLRLELRDIEERYLAKLRGRAQPQQRAPSPQQRPTSAELLASRPARDLGEYSWN